MHDVEAHVARAADAHDRVQVGAVVVERRADAVDDLGDLLDLGLEQPERRGVGQHQAGDVLVGLGAQVVEVDVAVLVGSDLDDLVAGHRHGRRVGPVGRVGRQHLGPLLAAVLVEGAGQQHAGELAVRAGRRLQRHVRQAGDLRQRVLQAPHQLERPLGALGMLERVQLGVTGQRRHPLVELRVVLHRARAERVEAGVEVEVALREAVVVAHDLGLGDLGQPRRLLAAQARMAAARRAGARARRARGATNARRPGCERSKIVSSSSAAQIMRAPAHSRGCARPRPPPSSASASRSMSARVRRSVIATSSPSSCSG